MACNQSPICISAPELCGICRCQTAICMAPAYCATCSVSVASMSDLLIALPNAQAQRSTASSQEDECHAISFSSTQQQLRRWVTSPLKAMSVDCKAPSLDIWEPQVSGRGPDRPL